MSATITEQTTDHQSPRSAAAQPAAAPTAVRPVAEQSANEQPRTALRILGPMEPGYDSILTPDALDFVAELHRLFYASRREVMAHRESRRAAIDRGRMPGFKPETAGIRHDPEWTIAPTAPGLEDRRVEIVAPACQAEAARALGSGAPVWIADLEDTMSPSWHNVVTAQVNLHRAVRGDLQAGTPGLAGHRGTERRAGTSFPTSGLGQETAYARPQQAPTIMLRPRGLHLPERHLEWVDEHGTRFAASATLVDLGLYLFHNAHELIAAGRGPYFCLPKLEAAREAAWFNAVFVAAQKALDIPIGTIRAGVIVETVTAAFQAEEILYELREHSAGLSTGRWDYIFSMIREFRNYREFILPDRDAIGPEAGSMRAFLRHIVDVCHRRGAPVLGGMSTYVPGHKSSEGLAVRPDKEAERALGFDGTWVSHPALVPLARHVFSGAGTGAEAAPPGAAEGTGSGPHPEHPRPTPTTPEGRETQLRRALLDVSDIAAVHPTEAGLRADIRLVLHYVNAWLSGRGMIEWDGQHQDASCAEICRAHIWQWIRHSVTLADGRPVTRELVARCAAEELAVIVQHPADHYPDAAEVLAAAALGDTMPGFLTTEAYEDFLVDWRVKREQAA